MKTTLLLRSALAALVLSVIAPVRANAVTLTYELTTGTRLDGRHHPSAFDTAAGGKADLLHAPGAEMQKALADFAKPVALGGDVCAVSGDAPSIGTASAAVTLSTNKNDSRDASGAVVIQAVPEPSTIAELLGGLGLLLLRRKRF